MSDYRLIRLGRQVQEEIAAMIIEARIKDPRVNSFLSISHVEISRDLAFADVYVSSYQTTAILNKGVEGLNQASGFIQSLLAKKMHTRQTPKLRFHPDSSIRSGFELIKKIEELNS